jgi:hypothetical protein
MGLIALHAGQPFGETFARLLWLAHGEIDLSLQCG